MQTIDTDVVVIGGGGAGLRAAIAAAEADPEVTVALVSKVVPTRSHTVAAEGGAAGVIHPDDHLDKHFDDTVSGGDWLCEQDVVEWFVGRCTPEMTQLEHWGCPWSRRPDGQVNVRYFGGMKSPRSWFAADRTGFHMLHTLFQTSLKYPSIRRFDECFCMDLLVEDGRLRGILAVHVPSGDSLLLRCRAAVLATGGAGRVYRQNTNAGIVTGEGMGMALACGTGLRDMEFVQWHPTTLPGSGLLITEGARGEGGILLNRHGRRYLQDHGLGPVDPWPRPRAMELGPRDRVSQAFWHEDRAGRTLSTPQGTAVHLDLRHLGRKTLEERLPQILHLARTFAAVDPVEAPIPVRPAVHYTMGGVPTNRHGATAVEGLYAAGECASTGLHGANRLGSNSLAELLVFGRAAGEAAVAHARNGPAPAPGVERQAEAAQRQWHALLEPRRGERLATLRDAMQAAMEDGVGIVREAEGMARACEALADLRARYRRGVRLDDTGRAFNTEWLATLELGHALKVAETIAHAALARRESRGAHLRSDGYDRRDDEGFLCHSLAWDQGEAPPRIDHAPVTLTRSAPGERVYGGPA
ncbi:fumarate reductase (quinol) flavoprotein subunit [Ectothiorhodospira mobilis]|uniref:fumarate reductase (quinol) flavoprotein subunit n=1 Tax=Ectothiorhodospira mobilis TaxID=195064 RepID=UPI001EE8EEE1|nr:fumarate reductase (quinol) flavoprotein subunit [Ectothiorhodospira mobilis]MCG5534685.1 fumarate reductase (quinol) flavoprotein subunit [Ectothiorhodospira mobilis]